MPSSAMRDRSKNGKGFSFSLFMSSLITSHPVVGFQKAAHMLKAGLIGASQAKQRPVQKVLARPQDRPPDDLVALDLIMSDLNLSLQTELSKK